MPYPALVLTLPPWVDQHLAGSPQRVPRLEDRMRLLIALSRRSLEEGGGPFAAGVFDARDGRLIAPGVNLVVPAQCSVAHAEVVAIVVAQRALGGFDLRGAGAPPCELVTTTEPCALCFGAIQAAGLRRVVCGARSEDAEAIDFDEGAKPSDWTAALAVRGIEVVRDVLREEAREVLGEYARRGLPVYHRRQP
jgi:tRNA(Arg) A34 adenosine deaminase TadA